VFRLARVLPLAAVCLGTALAAGAEPTPADVEPPPAAPEPVPAACPEAFAFETRLRGLLEASACAGPERRLLVTLRQEDDVSGTLVVLKDYQAEFVREVRGSSCAEVESALLLALEIFLDPGEAGDAACVAKDQSPTSAPTDWPGQDLDPFNLPEPELEPPEPIIEPQPVAIVRGVLQVDSSYAPTLAFGVAATARARLTLQNFLAFSVAHHTAPPFEGGGTVFLSATSFGVAFGQYLPIGANGEFSLQAGPRVALLEVGSSEVPGWDVPGTLAVELTVGLGFRLTRGVWAGFQGGGVVNLVHARYLDGAGGTAWEQPWAGATAGFYLSAVVPERRARPASRPGTGPAR